MKVMQQTWGTLTRLALVRQEWRKVDAALPYRPSGVKNDDYIMAPFNQSHASMALGVEKFHNKHVNQISYIGVIYDMIFFLQKYTGVLFVAEL